MTAVGAAHTGGTERDAWIVSRALALGCAWFRRVPDPVRVRVLVVATLAQWALECGWGTREDCFNGTNIKAYHWSGDTYERGGAQYRAYKTLDEAVEDYIAHLEGHLYGGALADLIEGGDPFDWYAAICRAGWCPWTEALATTFRGVLHRLE